MFRIDTKRLTAVCLLLLLMLSSAHAQEDILRTQEDADERIHYNTENVRVGTFEKTVTAQASAYYPMNCDVYFNQTEGVFVEYAVSKGDRVKAGDVLMRYSMAYDEIELTRLEMMLRRAEEDMKSGIRERENAISQMRIRLSSEKDGYEKQKLTVSLRSMQTELEQYRLRQNYSIQQQRKALEEAQIGLNVCELLAPADGIVDDLTYKKAGAKLTGGELLMNIYSDEIVLIQVNNASGSFEYNIPVAVTCGSGTNRAELTGRVVASDGCVPENEHTGYAYVLLDEYDAEHVTLRNIKVTAAQVSVDNVLIASKSAVKMEQGRYYVQRLHEGRVQKRYVSVAMIGTDVWLLDGVSEGDVLIVD